MIEQKIWEMLIKEYLFFNNIIFYFLKSKIAFLDNTFG